MKVQRQKLADLTEQFLNCMTLRKKISQAVQRDKKELGLESYDPGQELILFQKILHTKRLSLKELLIFSLLIEDGAGESYPQWSLKTHLLEDSDELFAQVNPLLLALTDKKSYSLLKIKSEYLDRINTVLWELTQK